MPTNPLPRHVALAVVFAPETHRLLMITSRKHADMWICEALTPTGATNADEPPVLPEQLILAC